MERERNTSPEVVVAEYADMIFRIAWQYVRNRQDAEDVTQEVLMAFLRHGGFDDKGYEKAWLIRVAVNKSKNAYNYNKRRKQTVFEDYMVREDLPADSGLREALDRLPPEDREIVYLTYYEGYTAKEIGKWLHKNEKAVAKQLSRARAKLKTWLDEEE